MPKLGAIQGAQIRRTDQACISVVPKENYAKTPYYRSLVSHTTCPATEGIYNGHYKNIY